MSLRRTSSLALVVMAALSLTALAMGKPQGKQAAPPPEKPAMKPTTKADALKAVKEAYVKQDTSLSKKDFQGFINLHGRDYTVQDKQGKTIFTMQTFQSQFAMLTFAAKEIKSTTGIKSISAASAEKVMAKVTQHIEATVTDPREQTPQPHKVVLDAVSDDTWTLRPRGWKKIQSKYIKYDGTVDGKPAAQMLNAARKQLGKTTGK